jgi:anti-sigma regulatory factor (Ser/Thr protein kinase)
MGAVILYFRPVHVGAFDEVSFPFPNDTLSVSQARRAVREHLEALGLDTMGATAELVTSELVGNAVLHTEGPIEVGVRADGDRVRISVFDTSPLYPVIPNPSPGSMTGRGLLMVRSLAVRFGFEPTPTGKVVWADLRAEGLPEETAVDELIDAWADDPLPPPPTGTYQIELGDVPTDLLLEAKSHVDNLVREFVLASSGAEAGITSTVPAHLAELIETVVNGFASARMSIKRQALEASKRGLSHVHLKLDLHPDAIEAGEQYLAALDQADGYCRAARLLTLETRPEHRVFRHWYVGEIVRQLRELEQGRVPGPPETFEHRLLEEL